MLKATFAEFILLYYPSLTQPANASRHRGPGPDSVFTDRPEELISFSLAARGPRIEEEYSLDEHGIVAITIKNLDAGIERNYRLGSGG